MTEWLNWTELNCTILLVLDVDFFLAMICLIRRLLINSSVLKIFHYMSLIIEQTNIYTLFSSVQFSLSVMSDSLWPHELQHARPPCPSPTPRVHPNPCPLSWWCHQSSHPLLSPSPPALNLSQHQGLFKWVSSSHQVAKVLGFQLQHQPFHTLRLRI